MNKAPRLTGGCQCGAVRYQLHSSPTKPHLCHCRMCQKAFGSYFAALALVPDGDLEWTRGRPKIYRLVVAYRSRLLRRMRHAAYFSRAQIRSRQLFARQPR